MTDFPFAIVGFDLDGTLVDSSGDLTDAVNIALAEVGRPPLSVEEVRPLIGGGSAKMLARGLDREGVSVSPLELARLNQLLLDHYAEHIAVHTRPYAGCLAALDDLAALGVRLAVVTNKKEYLARKLLDALNMTRRFGAIIGGDTVPGHAKPDAAPLLAAFAACGGGSTAFVGDSIFDTGAARNAGVPSIAVTFGFLDRPAAMLGADGIISHYDALIPALRALGQASGGDGTQDQLIGAVK